MNLKCALRDYEARARELPTNKLLADYRALGELEAERVEDDERAHAAVRAAAEKRIASYRARLRDPELQRRRAGKLPLDAVEPVASDANALQVNAGRWSERGKHEFPELGDARDALSGDRAEPTAGVVGQVIHYRLEILRRILRERFREEEPKDLKRLRGEITAAAQALTEKRLEVARQREKMRVAPAVIRPVLGEDTVKLTRELNEIETAAAALGRQAQSSFGVHVEAVA